MPIDPVDAAYRTRVAALLQARLAELEAQGHKVTYAQLADAMGEYGKEAIVRLVNAERPITLAIVERLAKALRVDLMAVLEELTGTHPTSTRAKAAAVGYLQLVDAFGAKAAGDPTALRAARAIADIRDQDTKRWLAKFVEAIARDHKRMTGARGALIRRPAVKEEGNEQ